MQRKGLRQIGPERPGRGQLRQLVSSDRRALAREHATAGLRAALGAGHIAGDRDHDAKLDGAVASGAARIGQARRGENAAHAGPVLVLHDTEHQRTCEAVRSEIVAANVDGSFELEVQQAGCPAIDLGRPVTGERYRARMGFPATSDRSLDR
jgi:hypothetical protein